MNLIIHRVTKLKIITFLIFLSNLWGNFDQHYFGFGLDIGSSGSGIFINGVTKHSAKYFSLNAELRFYDIKDPNETPVYNPYYGNTRTVGGISLLMLPCFIGLNYYPFVNKIENNFSPFITAKVGSILTIDGAEEGSFSNRWKNYKTQISPGGFFGCGIDFNLYGQTTVSTMVGREILPLRYNADGESDYSGMLIHIAFNRRIFQ